MRTRHFISRRLLIGCLLLAAARFSHAAEIPAHGVILQYHHVDEHTPEVTSVAPNRFAAQLAYLHDKGYIVWPLDRLLAAIRTGAPVPDRVVAITFDDAYVSIHRTALPLLRRYGMPFTLFTATDLVGTNANLYLTWDQIREMKSAGALIANHSRSHLHMLRRLDGESTDDWRARITAEIEGAQATIERETGEAPRFFAYPFGEYSNELKRLVLDLGYTALGQQSGPVSRWSDPGALPRYPMSGNYGDLAGIEDKLAALPLPVTDATLAIDPLLAPGDTRPVLLIELAPGDYAREQLACYASGQGRIPVHWVNALRFSAASERPVPVGRSRYNCTMPMGGEERYGWYSQLWIRRKDDGSWYQE